jgi:hypothetical protein
MNSQTYAAEKVLLNNLISAVTKRWNYECMLDRFGTKTPSTTKLPPPRPKKKRKILRQTGRIWNPGQLGRRSLVCFRHKANCGESRGELKRCKCVKAGDAVKARWWRWSGRWYDFCFVLQANVTIVLYFNRLSSRTNELFFVCCCAIMHSVYLYYPSVKRAVTWLWRLVAGLSRRKSEVNPSTVRVGFVENRETLGQVFLPLRQFPLSVSFTQCSICIPIYLSSTLYKFINCLLRSIKQSQL